MSASGHKGNLIKAYGPLRDIISFVASLDIEDLMIKNPGVPLTLSALEDLRVRLRDNYSLFLKRMKNGLIAAEKIEDQEQREQFLRNFQAAKDKLNPPQLEQEYREASTKLQNLWNQIDGAERLELIEPLDDLRNDDSIYGDEENPVIISDDEYEPPLVNPFTQNTFNFAPPTVKRGRPSSNQHSGSYQTTNLGSQSSANQQALSAQQTSQQPSTSQLGSTQGFTLHPRSTGLFTTTASTAPMFTSSSTRQMPHQQVYNQAASTPPNTSVLQLMMDQIAAMKKQSDDQAAALQRQHADYIQMQQQQANQMAITQQQQGDLMKSMSQSLSLVFQKIKTLEQPQVIQATPILSQRTADPIVSQQQSAPPVTPNAEESSSTISETTLLPGLHQLNALISRNAILEPIIIPMFDGNSEDFDNWWNTYSFSVHNNSMSTREKMARLRMCTSGQAAALISSFTQEPKNYDLCIEMIKENFDCKVDATQRIMLRLENLKKPGKAPAELRASYIDIFSNAKALMRLEPSEKSSPLFKIIMEKFPPRMQHKISRLRMNLGEEWTISAVLKELAQLIAVEEYNYKLYKTEAEDLVCLPFTTSSGSTTRPPKKYDSQDSSEEDSYESRGRSERRRYYDRSRGRSVERRRHQASSSSPTPSSENYKKNCKLCEKPNHHAVNCRSISNPDKRLEIIKTKGLCYLCLSANHRIAECHAQDCSKCGRRHHVTLCRPPRSSTTSPARNHRNRTPLRDLDLSNSNRVHDKKKYDNRDRSSQRSDSKTPFRSAHNRDRAN